MTNTNLFQLANLFQFATPQWIPFSFRLGSLHGFAFVRLPYQRFVAWNLEPDCDERVVWQLGKLNVTRPETKEEREDREMSESEVLVMEAEAARYIEWSY